MRPANLEVIGEELAIRWDDQQETFIRLEALRRTCPCAGCQGERDVMGNLYKAPAQPFTAESFKLIRLVPVGGYGVQPFWADGHNTGLYTFDYLRALGKQPAS
jgi:DUF971 family protein